MFSTEKRLFRQRLKSLRDKLFLTEPFAVTYFGASPAFLEYSRILQGSYPIPQLERPGSISSLAKREIELQFAKEDLPSYQRYSLGRILGFTPEQIHVMHKDIGKYFRFVMPDKVQNEKSFEEQVRQGKEDLDYQNACSDFEKIFAPEKAAYFFSVRLELNSSQSAYNIRVLSKPYKEFLLKDPVSQEGMDRLFDHLMSLPGELSKRIMLRAA